MTKAHRQEALSRAYVQAVAAVAGFTVGTELNDYGIDLFCTLTNRIGRRAFVADHYSVQVKSTTDPWVLEGNDSVEWLAKINPKVTQILAPRHGEIELVYAPSFHYHYTANEGFEGKDSVSYLVEVQGRRFKVVINFY